MTTEKQPLLSDPPAYTASSQPSSTDQQNQQGSSTANAQTLPPQPHSTHSVNIHQQHNHLQTGFLASASTVLTFTSSTSNQSSVPLPHVLVVDTTESVLMFCPFCAANVVTVVENAPGCLAYLTSAFLCLIGCGLCFFVPLCAPRCQDQVHRCPGCRRCLAVVPA
ncbi:LITAF-like zinc ribbon domain-containing protein [Chytriomyces cf. hyalinus JEL632]|nr:LITAF-like zinc ribbon domain-containing protein [Chytriomyces cf. hyalinus JEL632]